jgi:hypothetical protein
MLFPIGTRQLETVDKTNPLCCRPHPPLSKNCGEPEQIGSVPPPYDDKPVHHSITAACPLAEFGNLPSLHIMFRVYLSPWTRPSNYPPSLTFATSAGQQPRPLFAPPTLLPHFLLPPLASSLSVLINALLLCQIIRYLSLPDTVTAPSCPHMTSGRCENHAALRTPRMQVFA